MSFRSYLNSFTSAASRRCHQEKCCQRHFQLLVEIQEKTKFNKVLEEDEWKLLCIYIRIKALKGSVPSLK